MVRLPMGAGRVLGFGGVRRNLEIRRATQGTEKESHAGHLDHLIGVDVRGEAEDLLILSGAIAGKEVPDHGDRSLVMLDHESEEEAIKGFAVGGGQKAHSVSIDHPGHGVVVTGCPRAVSLMVMVALARVVVMVSVVVILGGVRHPSRLQVHRWRRLSPVFQPLPHQGDLVLLADEDPPCQGLYCRRSSVGGSQHSHLQGLGVMVDHIGHEPDISLGEPGPCSSQAFPVDGFDLGGGEGVGSAMVRGYRRLRLGGHRRGRGGPGTT